MIRVILSFSVFLSCLTSIFGQASTQNIPITKPVTGTITGQISGGEGQKFSDITVSLYNINTRERRTIKSNENGSFIFEEVPVGVYQIGAFTSAYVSSFPAKANNFRIGDHVSILMVKGGVITGKILDSAGRPIVGASVGAIRVRDDESRPTNPGQVGSDLTDDLGVYRIYGLTAGTFIISAAPIEAYNFVKHHETTTYHPSSTRDTAQEIVVQPGAEITGIDVIQRHERGFSVSGTAALKEGELTDRSGNVQLISALTGTSVATSFFNSARPTFAFYGIPDGEYEVTATRFFNTNSNDNQSGISIPTKVKVHGADVSGVVLNFISTASIHGRLTLEKLATPNPTCKISRNAALEETAILAIKEDPGVRSQIMQQTTLYANAELSVMQMSAGMYRLAANLPSDFWYLKAITFPSKTIKIDVARQGIYVRPGDKLTGVSMLIAEGAASIQGKIIAAPDQKLSSRIRVYAIPVSIQEADNLTRYYDVVSRDGTFTLRYLAPGKYWLYAAGINETEIVNLRNPNVWEPKLRSQLRQAAEAGGILLQLNSCQRVNDYSLKFSPTKK